MCRLRSVLGTTRDAIGAVVPAHQEAGQLPIEMPYEIFVSMAMAVVSATEAYEETTDC